MPTLINTIRPILLGTFTAVLMAFAAQADDIKITDAYARSSGKSAKSGAIFMEIMNTGAEDDRLIAASASIAKKAELHTHIQTDEGIMQMREVEGGFTVPAGGMHMLARGGDHVMLMGLTGSMEHGEMIELTLSFEHAGDVTIQVPVDLKRKPKKHKHTMSDN